MSPDPLQLHFGAKTEQLKYKLKFFTALTKHKSGFKKVRLDENSSLKATFRTPFGRYKHSRPPFSINFAVEEFQCKLCEKFDGLPAVEVIRDNI